MTAARSGNYTNALKHTRILRVTGVGDALGFPSVSRWRVPNWEGT